MLVLPHTTISVVRMGIITIDNPAGDSFPTLAGTNEVPASREVDLATDKDVGGGRTEGARLAIGGGGEVTFADLCCRSDRLTWWLGVHGVG